jgi:hypothetical protein
MQCEQHAPTRSGDHLRGQDAQVSQHQCAWTYYRQHRTLMAEQYPTWVVEWCDTLISTRCPQYIRECLLMPDGGCVALDWEHQQLPDEVGASFIIHT